MPGDFRSFGGRDPKTGRFCGSEDKFYGSRKTRAGKIHANPPPPVPKSHLKAPSIISEEEKRKAAEERRRKIDEAIANSKYRKVLER